MEKLKKKYIIHNVVYSKTDKSLLKNGKNNIRTPIKYFFLVCYNRHLNKKII